LSAVLDLFHVGICEGDGQATAGGCFSDISFEALIAVQG